MNKYLLILAITFFNLSVFSQNITNHGAKINIASGAYIFTNDFTNQNSGELILDGNLTINGDLNNNSNTNMFSGIEDTPDGTVYLSGTKSISGTLPVYFENIELSDYRTLNLDNCSVFGILTLNGTLDLNSNVLVIENSSNTAISYLSGLIISETDESDGLGIISWKIAENSGLYEVPFGEADAVENNLLVSVDISTAGVSDEGSVNFATYPTNSENQPIPQDVTLNNLLPLATIDRFWLVEPDYTTNPDFTLSLNYTENNINSASNNELDLTNLSIVRYNPEEDNWTDIQLVSTVTGNQILSDLLGLQVFKWFTVATTEVIPDDVIIPNGITPNADNYNDTWIIEGLEGSTVYIYNRWGNKVYFSDNYDNTWDGGNNPSGAYYYYLTTPDNKNYKGIVNLMR